MRTGEDIVKIQVPLSSTEPNPKALVYNKTRSAFFMVELTKELMDFMGDAVKKYAHVRIEGVADMKIIKEVKAENW